MSRPADARGLLPRFAQELVEQTLADTPITVIQGARQVGKRILARQVLARRDARLLSLDTTAVYEAAKADPDSFVRQTTGLLGIDEVQRVPELVLAMKDAVEQDRRPGVLRALLREIEVTRDAHRRSEHECPLATVRPVHSRNHLGRD